MLAWVNVIYSRRELRDLIGKFMYCVCIFIHTSLPLDEFATNIAIQCTEVYEYACSLADPAFVMPSFQSFKFKYAMRLADCGLEEEVGKRGTELTPFDVVRPGKLSSPNQREMLQQGPFLLFL